MADADSKDLRTILLIVAGVIAFGLYMRYNDRPTAEQRRAAEELYQYEKHHNVPPDRRLFDCTRSAHFDR